MLSKRLETISEMLLKGEVVFDCGSDHALLPCFLVQNDICQKAYAADLHIGPLNQAKANISRLHLEDKIETILSDGLDKMPDDVSVVVIAGMGYYTVHDILEKANLNNLKQIVVQVNRNVDKLRAYISDKNYTITNERIVKDNFFYEIVCFNTEYHDAYRPEEIMFGPINLQNKSSEFVAYIQSQIHTLEEIYQKNASLEILNKINYLKTFIN